MSELKPSKPGGGRGLRPLPTAGSGLEGGGARLLGCCRNESTGCRVRQESVDEGCFCDGEEAFGARLVSKLLHRGRAASTNPSCRGALCQKKWAMLLGGGVDGVWHKHFVGFTARPNCPQPRGNRPRQCVVGDKEKLILDKGTAGGVVGGGVSECGGACAEAREGLRSPIREQGGGAWDP